MTEDPIAKQILDKYKPLIIRKDKVFLRDGVAQVNTNNPEKYNPKKYDTDIVLQTPPKDAIFIEFEDEPDRNQRHIAEMEESCRAAGIECCVCEHKGGKSQYLRIYNIKNIPLGADNKTAKGLLLDSLLPSGAKKQLDKTNIGWTYSPVIGHQHWKPKYKEAIHELIRGTPPLEQVNEYPKDLLKKITKAKKMTKSDTVELLRNNQWVNDFLINYCTTHGLPKGSRHHTIEKNLAAIIYHREDKEEIIERYKKAQGRETNTLRTWFNAIATGHYEQVSVGEIHKYIREYEIDYVIPKQVTVASATPETPLDNKHIELLKDPKLIKNIVELIQSQGVTGEENTILVSINKTSLRLVKRHKATSSNWIVSDLSGSGKDAIIGATTKVMIPPDKLIHRTRFSDKALEYFMTNKPEGFTLDEYVIYLEDPEDELLKSQAFRVMASGQNKATVVKDQELLELEIKGKPPIVVTSMSASIDEEGGRRWDAIQTDTSETLTKLVIKDKLKRNTEGIGWKKIPKLAQAVQSLKPYEVIVPFAYDLFPYFEKRPSLVMRTQIDKFLDYVKASAVIHQYQRKKDSKGRLIADGFDYEYAKYVFDVLSDAEGGMLNTIERKLVEILKKAGRPLSLNEVSESKGFSRTKDWLYKHLDNFKSRRIIEETYEHEEKANKYIVKIYTGIGTSSFDLPHGSVLFGFIIEKENQNKEGFIGFIGFINILKELNEKRVKNGLLPLKFSDLDVKNLQVPLNRNKTNNTNKTKDMDGLLSQNKTTIKPTLKDKIKDLKAYCEKLKGQRNKITYETLVFNFDESFISQCLESDILRKLPNGNYEFGGV